MMQTTINETHTNQTMTSINHISTYSSEDSLNTDERHPNSNLSTFITENASFADRWQASRNTHWKVITLNVRGLNNDFKFSDTMLWLESNNIDIACLTETKLSAEIAKQRMKSFTNWTSFWSHDENHPKGSGIGLIIRKNIGQHVFTWKEICGRSIIATLKFKRKTNITIIGIYGPANATNKKTIKNILIKQYNEALKANSHILALGDFNEDENIPHHEKSLLNFFKNKNCIDLNTILYNAYSLNTWKNGNCTRILDHILVTDALTEGYTEACTINISKFTNSDHKGVIARIYIKHLTSKVSRPAAHKRSDKIINTKRCSNDHWKAYNEELDQTFIPSTSNDINLIWHTIKTQIINTAMQKLIWKKVGRSSIFNKSESISHSAALHCNQVIKKTKQYFTEKITSNSTLLDTNNIKTDINLQCKNSLFWLNKNFPQAGWNSIPNVISNSWSTTKEKTIEHMLCARKNTKKHCSFLQFKEDQEQIRNYISKRNDAFVNDKGVMLQSALSRKKQFLDTSALIIEGEWETDAILIKQHIAKEMAYATRTRNIIPPNDFWKEIYNTKVNIPEAFENTLDLISEKEFNEILSTCGNNKASGPSKITIECWKHAPESVQTELLRLFNLCLYTSTIPVDWKIASICPIPKASDWKKEITNTRPITLLETARKIFTKIITARLESSCRNFNLLKGFNHCATKGSSCNAAIATVTSVINHAHKFKQEAWIAFQDMKKAYDSVAWQGLQLAMERINIPSKIINLFKHIHTNRKSFGLTAHGPTECFEIGDGIDQGETYAPLLWRIFYDPLLVAIANTCGKEGFQFEVKHNVHPAVAELLSKELIINHAAFVDDTTWIANSRTGLEKITNLAASFFKMNDIQINPSKTEVISINNKIAENEDAKWFNFDATTQVPIRTQNWPIRYLGIWTSADNSNKHTINCVNAEITSIIQFAIQKAIPDKIAAYIINAVILPTIEYRTQAHFIADTQLDKWGAQINKFLRSKAYLGRGVKNNVIRHPEIYNIPAVKDFIYKSKACNLLGHYVDNNLLGQLTKVRLALLQDALWNELNPLQHPDMIIGAPKNIINTHIGMCIKALSTFNIHITTAIETSGIPNATPILDLCIRPSMRPALIPFLRKMNIRYVQDLLVENQVIPYSILQQSSTGQKRGRPFSAYTSLVKMLQHSKIQTGLQISSNLISKSALQKPILEKQQNHYKKHIHYPLEYGQEIFLTKLQIADKISTLSKIKVYTDGAHSYNEDSFSSGFGCFFEDINCQIEGKCSGIGGSLYAEIFAIAVTLDIAHHNQAIHIFSDCLSAIQILDHFTHGKNIPVNHLLNLKCRRLWQYIEHLISTKKLSIISTHVKSHTGIHGNERADQAAKAGKLKSMCTLNYLGNSSIPFSLMINEQSFDIKPRHLITTYTNVNSIWNWTQDVQKTTSNDTTLDWNSTKTLINIDGPIRSGYASSKSCSLRSFVIKSQVKALPTHAILHNNWPKIYLTDECPFCFESETNDHIWTCKATESIRSEMIQKALDTLNTYSISSTDILKLWKGFVTRAMATAIRNQYKCKDKTLEEQHTQKRNFITFERKILRIILEMGFSLWITRNNAAISFQKTKWNVQKRTKKPTKGNSTKNTTKQSSIHTTILPNDTHTHLNTPYILIDNSKIHESLYYCECGKSIFIGDHSKCFSIRGKKLEFSIALLNIFYNNVSPFSLIFNFSS
jgi:exonuclease III/ribonuclease HI